MFSRRRTWACFESNLPEQRIPLRSRIVAIPVIGIALALLFTAAVLSLGGCGSNQDQPAYAQQVQQPVVAGQAYAPAPVIVQQPASNDGFFTGLMMGHLFSGGYGGGYHSHTTIVEHHYHETPAPVPAAQPTRSWSSPTPTTKSIGGYTYAPRPSPNSSWGSSFSGGRSSSYSYSSRSGRR